MEGGWGGAGRRRGREGEGEWSEEVGVYEGGGERERGREGGGGRERDGGEGGDSFDKEISDNGTLLC